MGAEVVATRRRADLPLSLLRRVSDERLVEHARAGSLTAFEVLFDRHRRPVLAFCRHMLGSVDDAEDAVQQTFMAVYREIGCTDPPPVLRPWLYGIARHRCLTALRARRERSLADALESGTDHVVRDVTARDDLRAVLADVTCLPDDQRAALILSELGDMPHAEIGALLGCRRDQVKALVFQARAALVTGRAARETPCAEIRHQLRTLRGPALRRSVLRRHLRGCPDCGRFWEAVRVQRRMRALLPLGPLALLKRAVLLVTGSGGGGTAGAGLTAVAAWPGAALVATAALATATAPGLELGRVPTGGPTAGPAGAATQASGRHRPPERSLSTGPVRRPAATRAHGRGAPRPVLLPVPARHERRTSPDDRGPAASGGQAPAASSPLGGAAGPDPGAGRTAPASVEPEPLSAPQTPANGHGSNGSGGHRTKPVAPRPPVPGPRPGAGRSTPPRTPPGAAGAHGPPSSTPAAGVSGTPAPASPPGPSSAPAPSAARPAGSAPAPARPEGSPAGAHPGGPTRSPAGPPPGGAAGR